MPCRSRPGRAPCLRRSATCRPDIRRRKPFSASRHGSRSMSDHRIRRASRRGRHGERLGSGAGGLSATTAGAGWTTGTAAGATTRRRRIGTPAIPRHARLQSVNVHPAAWQPVTADCQRRGHHRQRNQPDGTRSTIVRLRLHPCSRGRAYIGLGTGTAGSSWASSGAASSLRIGVVAHQAAHRGGAGQAGVIVPLQRLDLACTETDHLHDIGNRLAARFARPAQDVNPGVAGSPPQDLLGLPGQHVRGSAARTSFTGSSVILPLRQQLLLRRTRKTSAQLRGIARLRLAVAQLALGAQGQPDHFGRRLHGIFSISAVHCRASA
jgi:hypothetical protein